MSSKALHLQFISIEWPIQLKGYSVQGSPESLEK